MSGGATQDHAERGAAVSLDVTGLISAVLRGEDVPEHVLARADVEDWSEAAERHGVLPLLAERLQGSAAPEELQRRLRQTAHGRLAEDMALEAGLRALLAALDAAGIPALLMKGTPLAYTHYARPDLRPRLDTDVLIPVDRRDRTDRALRALGYTTEPQPGASYVMYQRTYVAVREGLPDHVVDVHWRLANPEVFGNVLTFEEMSVGAVSLPALGPAARALSDLHALLVACVHRVAHHYDEDRLIWLYDIHLLASRLPPAAWAQFTALSAERHVAAICRVSLRKTADRFGTHIPQFVMAEELGTARPAEVTARYLTSNRSRLRLMLEDLRVLPTWTDRWRLVREHAFPPSAYMREVYAPASGLPLPWLYLRRIVHGARKWLARW
jgi:hypothetical protein